MKFAFILPLVALLLTGCATRSYPEAPPPGPTLAEIQTMVKANVSDSVIVSQIKNSSTRYHLTTDQIIALKKAGVSDKILNALINTASKPRARSATTTSTYVYPAYPSYPVYVNPWPWWGWEGGFYWGDDDDDHFDQDAFHYEHHDDGFHRDWDHWDRDGDRHWH